MNLREEQRKNQINDMVFSHLEYPDHYKELRIIPEPLKPPVVASNDVTLDEDEILILSEVYT